MDKIKAAVSEIADQLSTTIDNDFDIHISVDSDQIEIQKLCMLTNFLLENVRRNIGDLQKLTENLEERASERTRRLDLVISGSNDGVWIWDMKSKSIEYSSQWLTMIGLNSSVNENSPATWFDRVHPKDQAGLQSAIRAHLDGLTANLNAEYRIRHINGLYRWMMCRGMAYRNDSGVAELFAGTQTDITTLRGVDQSTGLPNESYFNELLDELVETNRGFFVGFVRISRLHVLTETMDGPALDKLRKEIAGRIVATSPLDVVLARLPGDIFAITLPTGSANDLSDVQKLCADLKRVFSKPFSIEIAGDQTLDITIGLTEMSSSCELTRSEILGTAWTALRAAGRRDDLLCIYDLEAREHAFQILRLERELRPALNKGMFETHLQPIVSMQDQSICGYEALMRLNHHEMGMIPPDEFIPLAETSGLMKDLGYNILCQSVEALDRLIASRPDAANTYVSVNVSPVQLASSTFAENIQTVLANSGLSAENLRLEVTETAVVKNMDSALDNLTKIRKMGVKIALDDFGTGYSSLSYLRRLPVDVLKIDRSFITNIDVSDSKRAIVETIYGLARLLSLDVVAEGIETVREYEVLQKVGVAFGQGYLFGKPREAALVLQEHPAEMIENDRVYHLQKVR